MPDYLDEMLKRAKEKKKVESASAGEKVLETEPKLSERFLAQKMGELKADSKSAAPDIEDLLKPLPKAKSEISVIGEQRAIIDEQQQQKPDTGLEQRIVEFSPGEKSLLESYGEAKIYRVEGSSLLHYEVPVPKPTSGEKAIISAIKEAATRLITIAPYRIRDPVQKRNVYYQKILEILKNSPELSIPENRFEFYANAVVREMVGYGIIDSLVKDDLLEEIMIISSKHPVYVFHRQYEMMTTNIQFFSDNEIQDLINRIAREVGRRVDIAAPLLDARLPDGSRVNATVPPASVEGSSLTVRKFRKDPYTLVDLINLKTLNVETAAFLWLCVEGLQTKPASILISGGTGSGKTTTLNVLAALIPERERIITIEDTAELNLPIEHWIRLEARPPGLEGTGELTMDILTKNSLRMRPDRIIVGEVRHAEAFTLFTALNTGHDGSLGTLHANSPEETLIRIMSPPMNVPETMLAGLDLIIVENRLHDKRKGTIRRITEIAQVVGVLEGKTKTQNIFEWNAVTDQIERTVIPIAYLKKLEKFTGLDQRQLQAEWEKRKQFLNRLAQQNIHELSQVREAVEEFFNPKGQHA